MHLRQSVVFRVDSGEDQTYVLDIARNGGAGAAASLLAAAGSDHVIKLYSMADDGLRLSGRLAGHTATIGAVHFSPTDPHVLWSVAEDGHVSAWDTRTQQSAMLLKCRSGAPLLSMDVSANGALVAAGSALQGDDAVVAFWDPRAPAQSIAEFVECHMDDVTQTRFHPTRPDVLATAGEDGLANIIELRANFDEDESLESVLNVGQNASRVGFFGRNGEFVYCCTNVESLSLWRAAESDRLVDYGDLRLRLAERGIAIDYLIDCQYDAAADRLVLAAGTYDGVVRLLSVTLTDIAPMSELTGGHTDRVRCIDWDLPADRLITAGEDGRLSVWRSAGPTSPLQADRNRLVMTPTARPRKIVSPYLS